MLGFVVHERICDLALSRLFRLLEDLREHVLSLAQSTKYICEFHTRH